MEKAIPFIVYLPLGVIYCLGMIYAAFRILKGTFYFFFRNDMPTQKEIDNTDKRSIDEITYGEIVKLNENRGEKKLSYGNLVFAY